MKSNLNRHWITFSSLVIILYLVFYLLIYSLVGESMFALCLRNFSQRKVHTQDGGLPVVPVGKGIRRDLAWMCVLESLKTSLLNGIPTISRVSAIAEIPLLTINLSIFSIHLEKFDSSSYLSGVYLNFTLTSDRILNLYLMSLRTAILKISSFGRASVNQ